MDLPRFSEVALDLFSSEDVLVPPVLFYPWGGELVSNITKFGSSVRILAAPLPCPVILDRYKETILVGSVFFVYIVLLGFGRATLFSPRYVILLVCRDLIVLGFVFGFRVLLVFMCVCMFVLCFVYLLCCLLLLFWLIFHMHGVRFMFNLS